MIHTLSWPDTYSGDEASAQLKRQFEQHCRMAELPDSYLPLLQQLYLPLGRWLQQRRQQLGQHTLCLGVIGGQGSGKSTLTGCLQQVMSDAFGWRCAGFSLDDIYLTRTERQQLSQEIHPLLATRGVPGTHDTGLGLNLIQQLRALGEGETVALPSFNKAIDDRRPADSWPTVAGPIDLIIFEGWCVGVAPQAEAELIEPVNALEAQEDTDGRWRHYVNQQLQHNYRDLFAQLDSLLMLEVPGLAEVKAWRTQQEQQLSRHQSGHGVMSSSQLSRFLMHYQRLTEHALSTLPASADICLRLNADHGFEQVSLNGTAKEN